MQRVAKEWKTEGMPEEIEWAERSGAQESESWDVSMPGVKQDVNKEICWMTVKEMKQAKTQTIKPREACGAEWDESKKKEFNAFEKYEAFEKVSVREPKAKGIRVIDMTMVYTVKEDGRKKTRGCLRGDMEEKQDETRSPTVGKWAMMLVFMLAAAMGWHLRVADVPVAFLKGSKKLWKQRCQEAQDTYVRPPKSVAQELMPESLRCGVDEVWKVTGPVYGLRDVPLIWFRTFEYDAKKFALRDMKFAQSRFDPCLFWVKKEGAAAPIGCLILHVDDVEWAGTGEANEMIEMFLRKYEVEEEMIARSEEGPIKHCGRIAEWGGAKLVMHQNHYVSLIHPIEIPSGMKLADELTPRLREECHSRLGQMAWLATNTCGDLAVAVSEYIGVLALETTLELVKKINGIVAKLKDGEYLAEVVFRAVGGFGELGHRPVTVVVSHDASRASMPGHRSQGGVIIGIVDTEDAEKMKEAIPKKLRGRRRRWNEEQAKFQVLDWSSFRLRRVVKSTYAGEAMCMSSALDRAILWREMLKEAGGNITEEILLMCDALSVVTSCENQKIYSLEKRTAIDIAQYKEEAEAAGAKIIWCPTEYQVSDGLTKWNWTLAKKVKSCIALGRIVFAKA